MDWSVINREIKLLCKILYWPKKKEDYWIKKIDYWPKKNRNELFDKKTPFIDFWLTTIR